jgi:Fe-S oxidoreductase
MCPSYRVTHEEMHSTRGRARLLFEMLEGDPLREGWQSEAVREALDLCLACKGCKGDCPVNVDMATYKAEFLSHYYERKRRPIHAYAFGLMPWAAHLASKMPRLVNALAQAPLLGDLAKAIVTMAPQRRIPVFAERSFRDWWRARGSRPNAGRERVILWADTWNTYFHADTARHALEVLEAAGYDVVVPEQTLCCGRPLYDYGMLDLAKVLLREVIGTLRSEIEAGTPIVVLEPSCASVFKDELLNLFPNDKDAQRLSRQVVMFGDFLVADERWASPKLDREVILHQHCHHKSVPALAKSGGEERALEKLGARVRKLDDGCCGMAGAFGFEAPHYDVSVACGELDYLPAVRKASSDAIVIGGGFSCREQAMQCTDRQALHLADVVWLAMRYGPQGPPGPKPELAAMPDVRAQAARARLDAVLGGAALAVATGGVVFALLRKGRSR